MGIRDRLISARSPRQNGYAERLIASIRRDCLDHVVVLVNGIFAVCSIRIKDTTTRFAHTYPYRRTHRSRATFRESDTCSHRQSWADCTINMFAFEFPTRTRDRSVHRSAADQDEPLAARHRWIAMADDASSTSLGATRCSGRAVKPRRCRRPRPLRQSGRTPTTATRGDPSLPRSDLKIS
jgi:hypothetical protein